MSDETSIALNFFKGLLKAFFLIHDLTLQLFLCAAAYLESMRDFAAWSDRITAQTFLCFGQINSVRLRHRAT